MITVTLPVPPEQVKAEVERVRRELVRLATEQRMLQELIRGIYACCPHTNTRSYMDMAGDHCAVCKDCGWSS